MCAVTTTGAVHCWGDNDYGQAPETVAGSFVQLSAGYSHTCGLRTDGRIACWGANTYPECDAVGGYCHEVYKGQANPPSVLSKQVSAGDYHTCSLRSPPTPTAGAWRVTGPWTASGPNSWVAAADRHPAPV